MIKKLIKLIVIAVVCLVAAQVKADAATENWSGTIGDKTYSSGTTTVTLTGKVTLNGTITINAGATLIIQPGNGYLIKRNHTGVGFNVAKSASANGKLKITGTKAKRVVLDGGAVFSTPGDARTTFKSGISATEAMINCAGDMDLQYVDIQNCNNDISGYGGGLRFVNKSSSSIISNVNLTNVKIAGCIAYRGSAILIECSSYHLLLTMTSCEICYCNTQVEENSGTVRSYGATSCTAIIDGCIIHDNRSCGNAGAFAWAAGGVKGGNEYPSKLTIKGKTQIYNNVAQRKGGAIFIQSLFDLQSADIYNNTAMGDGGGIHIATYKNTIKSMVPPFCFNINDDVSIHNNKASSGGGIYISITGSPNTSLPLGGIANFQININKGSIYENEATDCGGGIYFSDKAPKYFENYYGKQIEYMTTININSGDVYNNKASSDGGAIYVKRSIESDVDYSKGVADFKFNLSGGNIFGNKAGLNSELTDRNGGAFCVIDDMTAYGRASKFIISDDSSPLKVHDNTTTKNGGVIYLKNGDIEITGGELYANTAGNDGGAFYVDGGSLTASAGSILSNNTTNGNGGGFYVNSGNVTVADDFIIGGNTAAKNGGGFYVNGGDVGISGASISSNHAVSGAGLYSNGGAVTFTSGDIGSNISSGNGGGIYVNGGSVTYTGNLKGNTACNGGGLYLASGATMTYKGGIISGNKAVASESATATTAYHGGAGNIQGCGGGIYLQNGPSSSKKTSLLFDLPSDRKVFGLYTNEADKAGAEIVSEGGYTSVQLPAIHDMQLIGFEGVEASPSWYQDYFTGDTGYNQDKGHAVEGTVSTVDRLKNLKELGGYQYMEHRIPDERLSQILDHYLCLTLDFNFLNITLKAKGLLGHETALFRLIHHGTVKNTAYDVLLRADKGASETLMNMPWGTYSVVPNNEWHREYDPVESKEDVRIGETDNYVIEYNMNHKSAAQMPQHDERQIQGKDVPSSTVEGEKPEKYNRKEF